MNTITLAVGLQTTTDNSWFPWKHLWYTHVHMFAQTTVGESAPGSQQATLPLAPIQQHTEDPLSATAVFAILHAHPHAAACTHCTTGRTSAVGSPALSGFC